MTPILLFQDNTTSYRVRRFQRSIRVPYNNCPRYSFSSTAVAKAIRTHASKLICQSQILKCPKGCGGCYKSSLPSRFIDDGMVYEGVLQLIKKGDRHSLGVVV